MCIQLILITYIDTAKVKITRHSLIEIVPKKFYTVQYLKGKSLSTTAYKFAGEGIANLSNVSHRKKKITLTKRIGGLLSVTARVFSGKPKLQHQYVCTWKNYWFLSINQ